jgi:2-polyprenyl-3-methyl-5-hydroxy-6-metoxy-1,4-benzoquinol methylase
MNEAEIRKFYNELSGSYDSMTNFDERLRRELPFFQSLIHQYKIHTALDAGCGSGGHSILLSKAGADVVAVDLSPKMIEQAKKNAQQAGCSIEFRQADFSSLPKLGLVPFDAVFCMGNTLPHCGTYENLVAELQSFRTLIKEGGTLICHILNYDKILKDKSQIQHVRVVGSVSYTRWYVYTGENITFNITIEEKKDKSSEPRTISVRLLAITSEMMRKALTATGFSQYQYYGSIEFEPFAHKTSRDLIVVARER